MSLSQPKYYFESKPGEDQLFNINIIDTTNIDNNSEEGKENQMASNLSNLVDNVNNNILHVFYPKGNSIFKEKIDKLNLKFYLETEKYLSDPKSEKKCQETLFLILFQEINLYIEEIERLNILLHERSGTQKYTKKVDQFLTKPSDSKLKESLIKTLRESNVNLQEKVNSLLSAEDQIKLENESLKRQNKYYQEQFKNFIEQRKDENSCNLPSITINTDFEAAEVNKKRYYSDTYQNSRDDSYRSSSQTNENVLFEMNNINNNIKDKEASFVLNKSNLSSNKQKNANINENFRKPNKFISKKNEKSGIQNSTNKSNSNLTNNTSGNSQNFGPVQIKDTKINKNDWNISVSTSNYSTNSNFNRCRSPNITSSNSKSLLQKELNQCENELKELADLEEGLKKFKSHIFKENHKSISINRSTNSDNICGHSFVKNKNTLTIIAKVDLTDKGSNTNSRSHSIIIQNNNIHSKEMPSSMTETVENKSRSVNKNRKEVFISDLEDYDKNKNIINEKNSKKSFKGNGPNSVTINLEDNASKSAHIEKS